MKVMRTVGHRKERPISFSASAEMLVEDARFNDEIHKLPSGNLTFIPKGVYRFKSFEEKNRFDFDCVVACIVHMAKERS
jgi:hypothetical protein